MRGFTQQITLSPQDHRLPSHPITISVPVSTTRVVNFYNEFLAIASSVLVINRDATNPITVIINNDRANSFTIPANGSLSLEQQWVEQIEVVSAALGVVVILGQLVNAKTLGISVI